MAKKQKAIQWPPDMSGIRACKHNKHGVYEMFFENRFEVPLSNGCHTRVIVDIAYDEKENVYYASSTVHSGSCTSSYSPSRTCMPFKSAQHALRSEILHVAAGLRSKDFMIAADELESRAGELGDCEPPAKEGHLFRDLRIALIRRGLEVVKNRGFLTADILAADLNMIQHNAELLYKALIKEKYVQVGEDGGATVATILKWPTCPGTFDPANPWPEGSTILMETPDGAGGGSYLLREVDLENQIMTLTLGSGECMTISFDNWNFDYASAVDEVRFPNERDQTQGTRDQAQEKAAATEEQPASTTIEHLPVARHVELPPDKIIIVEGRNDRRNFDQDKLTLLGESMIKLDQLEEIIVNQRADGTYELVAGERRLRAANAAGMELIQCKAYKKLTALQIAVAADAENNQRENLNHIEKGYRYKRYADGGLSVPQIAQLTGDSDDAIRRHLSLMRLTQPVADLVASGKLPIHQAELIARVGDVARQIELTEKCLALGWDSKKGKWSDKPNWQWKEGDPKDFVMSMDNLRKEVSYAMCGLASCGWLKDEEKSAAGFAGQRVCEGCPDNTQTYADQPTLFAGVRPQGSDKKGFCTNRLCYEIKTKAWEKVAEKRRKELEKQQKAALARAKRAGLDICPCGKIAQAGETFDECKQAGGAKLCPKCFEKEKKAAKRQSSSGKGASKPFPSTPEEHLMLAVWNWGCDAAKQVVEKLKKTPDDQVDWMLLLGLTFVTDEVYIGYEGKYQDREKSWKAVLETIKSGGYPRVTGVHAAAMTESIINNLLSDDQWSKPNEHNRSITDGVCEEIEIAEVLAVRLGIEIPPRPTAASIKDEAIRTEILTAGRDILGGVLNKITIDNVSLLDQILRDAAEGKIKPKPAKWHVKAMMERVGEIKGFDGIDKTPSSPAAGGNGGLESGTCHICGCSEHEPCPEGCSWTDGQENLCTSCVEMISIDSKNYAGKAIAKMQRLDVLKQLQDSGEIQGDWRRSAVAKRIKELGK